MWSDVVSMGAVPFEISESSSSSSPAYHFHKARRGAAQLRFAADAGLAFARPAQLKPGTLCGQLKAGIGDRKRWGEMLGSCVTERLARAVTSLGRDATEMLGLRGRAGSKVFELLAFDVDRER